MSPIDEHPHHQIISRVDDMLSALDVYLSPLMIKIYLSYETNVKDKSKKAKETKDSI